MNHDTIVLLIRAMLTCLDKDQAKMLEAWIKRQAIGSDPASDSFMNAEKRRINVAIGNALIEIEVNAGINS